MKLSLYQIEQEYLQLAEILISNGGETTEELETALAINKENLETKATNYGFVCKELDAHNAIIKGEIDRLKALMTAREKTADKLRSNISAAMQLYGFEKIESPVMKLSFRKSETVEFDDSAAIPAKFITEKVTESIDKTAIKAAIKSGEAVPGAYIKEHQNLQIK